MQDLDTALRHTYDLFRAFFLRFKEGGDGLKVRKHHSVVHK